MNSVSLIGRLTKDIKIKQVKDGLKVSYFVLAVPRRYNNKKGNNVTDFVNCEIWNKGAQILQKYSHKGSLLGIDGEVHTSKYINSEDVVVYKTIISVNKFTFLDTKKKSSNLSNDNATDDEENNINDLVAIDNANNENDDINKLFIDDENELFF